MTEVAKLAENLRDMRGEHGPIRSLQLSHAADLLEQQAKVIAEQQAEIRRLKRRPKPINVGGSGPIVDARAHQTRTHDL